jgi:suppressor of ftsI/bilirubin oxidase
MNSISRRHFISSLSALGMAGATTGIAFAAGADGMHGSSAGDAAAVSTLEKAAATFANPLRLPGTSGLYGVLPASEFREVHVVRTEIEVLPGQRTPYLAYAVESGGKKFLNPALLAHRGDEMRVRLINDLDEPTVIHWHGLSIDARNDGNGTTVVEPGQSLDYAFQLRDRASMYWYHPHAHGTIAKQAYHGLASLLFIDDDEETALRRVLDLALGETEIPLVLQDRQFDAQGHLQYAPTATDLAAGWVGERLLVNLTDRPFIQAGRRIVRFRILNGSNARTYRLAFLQGGRKLGFFLAGTDGGLLAAPQRIDQSFISPGQRLDVLVDLREVSEGQAVTLATLAFDPMHAEGAGGHGGHEAGAMAGMADMAGMDHSKMAMPAASMAGMAMDGDAHALLRIDVKASPAYNRKIPTVLSALPAAVAPKGAPRRMKLALDAKGRWTINGWSFDPKAVPVTVKRGAAETWLIENARRSMPHPMHLHGFKFRVVERLGSPAQLRALAGAKGLLAQDRGVLDTVHVWPGESVRIALDFSHPFAGDQDYVFHCHNLEHEEGGMMIRYAVKG